MAPNSAPKWLKQTFDEADKNGDGSLSIGEVLQLLHKLNVNLPRHRVKQMFKVGWGSGQHPRGRQGPQGVWEGRGRGRRVRCGGWTRLGWRLWTRRHAWPDAQLLQLLPGVRPRLLDWARGASVGSVRKTAPLTRLSS